MRIGVPKEIKNHEYRVGMTPAAVRELTSRGHEVFVETMPGTASVWATKPIHASAPRSSRPPMNLANADMIVKVKEPQPVEIKRLTPKHTLFTYLHLAPDPEQTKGCRFRRDLHCYETVTDSRGGLPLLAPMSEVAGRMSIQAGAHSLEKAQGGRGMLLGGVPGVPAAKVVVLGGGVVGTNAARMAMGLEAHVTILDVSLHRLNELDLQFGAMLNTIFSTIDAVEEYVTGADLVIGGVLLPGAASAQAHHRKMVSEMKKGSVIVDVAIDQGGCAETSHATTTPIRPMSSTASCITRSPTCRAASRAPRPSHSTTPRCPYHRARAAGRRRGDEGEPASRAGLNVYKNTLTYKAVADAQGLPFKSAEAVLGM